MTPTAPTEPRPDPFEIDLGGPVANGLFALARPVFDRATGLGGLRRIYDAIPDGLEGVEVMRWALEHLDVRVDVDPRDLERIPREGPVLVVANHPFGAIEGIALAGILAEVRPDVRILANFLLGRMPQLRDLFVLVDPFGGEGAKRANVQGVRDGIRWLKDGGLLATFPAGEVASFDLARRRVVDPEWSPTVARIARKAGCPVVPLHFAGRNGALFQLAGLLHSRLRTALLPRQMLNQRGGRIDVRIGSAVPASRLAAMADDRHRIAYLRDRTDILAERERGLRGPAPVQPRSTPASVEPLIEPVPADALAAEIEALPEDARMATGDGLQVWLAEADRVPGVLREIGRLREVTFRAVGEGTGRALDIDRHDPHYLHLFVWNPERREIVGAYRLGPTDRLLARFGKAGLYTSSLFQFRTKLFESMGPALEMGRSFIRPEYQRSYTGLLLLWKGIGAYVCREPRYATLFGPVSISAEYRGASQQLMVSFLSQNRFVHDWSRWVRPRTPFDDDPARVHASTLATLDDVSEFIREIEADQKGVPILLRQYLKLGGRLLGFNVDPAFSHVLDVLILVDLRETDPKILGRYMGRDAAAGFLAHQAAGKTADRHGATGA